MDKIEKFLEMVDIDRLSDLLGKKEEKKKVSPWVVVLIVIGVLAVLGGVAFAIYKYVCPNYLMDMDDEYDDDYEDEDDDNDIFED
ncbi:MAG: DUF4366 domain-containing protein [Lachnospiraceae bacterium]|nr:DUF4366 domain-containing protein [Lachnospiraceae bacterium]